MKLPIACLLIILGAFTQVKAQEKPLVQFTGVIYNSDTPAVVPYVTVTNRSQGNRAFSANYQGYFSFVAREGDTVAFSAIGYSKEGLVIPQNLPEKKYTVIVRMKPQTINLPTVKLFPWASEDEFNQEFLTMKIADDDLAIAKKNLSRGSLLALAKTLPRDGDEHQALNFQNNHISLSNKVINQRGANPLLDPFKWGAFIRQIMKGDKSRQDDEEN
jgi:hypothetical protein